MPDTLPLPEDKAATDLDADAHHPRNKAYPYKAGNNAECQLHRTGSAWFIGLAIGSAHEFPPMMEPITALLAKAEP